MTPYNEKGRCDLVAPVDPNVSPFVGSRERVEDSYAGRLVVGHIARDDGKSVHQRRRCDLLVQWILGMWHAQPAPYLRFGELLPGHVSWTSPRGSIYSGRGCSRSLR